MSLLLFIAALVGIVVFAMVVNRLTGTTSKYLDAFQLEPGEQERWRDIAADVALVPRLGRAVFMSFSRLRRHTVVWSDRRIVVAQKGLFSKRRVITHQIHFADNHGADGAAANKAALEFGGGFYGRGFQTIIAQSWSFGQRNQKDCVCVEPTEACGAAQNIGEVLIFTDRLADLEQCLQTAR